MSPSAITGPGHAMPGVPGMSAPMDAAFWGQQHRDLSSDTTSPISPSHGLHMSPTSSSAATHDSFTSNTSPAQTPPLDSGKKNAQNGAKKDTNSAQARASVAVACVPCRSRHLKCDGGVRCSRCRADGVECTYIKSRRGWKGKRKTKDDNSGQVALNGT